MNNLNLEQKILSDITVHMKYAKHLPKKERRETFEEIVTRNKEMHIKKFPDLKEEIEKNYKLVYDKKVLPSMRAMQFSGKPIEISPNRIFNCSFCPVNHEDVFSEIMFLLLGGTGVGFSVQKHHVEELPAIRKPREKGPYSQRRYLIGDSIEGWADSVKVLMNAYFHGKSRPIFDFSDIRKKGAKLVTSGGKAPGPEPLRICLTKIESLLRQKEDGENLSPIEVHDIICFIADAVLAGGIRRAALISLFSADDQEMLSAKSGLWWEKHPERARANNSVVLLRHKIKKSFFYDLWKKIELSNSGEPGFYFTNDKEWGTNPCCEIGLRPFQFCNLTTINVSNVESQEDLEERARTAAFIGTLQASYTDFHYLRPIWKKTTEKDALIGVSMTGIASGKIVDYDLKSASKCVVEENSRVAKLIGINSAARTTAIKPEGTSTLVLGGIGSGIHAVHSKYYLRRIRVGKNESIYTYLYLNHPELLEDDVFRAHDTAIITVPMKSPENSITRENETSIKLLERVKYFSDNWIKPGHLDGHNTHNVSATISIKENDWEEVGKWMWENRNSYNGLSVLPFDGGSYTQAPFEEITKEEFEKKLQFLKDIDLTQVIELEDNTDLKGELACAGGKCEVM